MQTFEIVAFLNRIHDDDSPFRDYFRAPRRWGKSIYFLYSRGSFTAILFLKAVLCKFKSKVSLQMLFVIVNLLIVYEESV